MQVKNHKPIFLKMSTQTMKSLETLNFVISTLTLAYLYPIHNFEGWYMSY